MVSLSYKFLSCSLNAGNIEQKNVNSSIRNFININIVLIKGSEWADGGRKINENSITLKPYTASLSRSPSRLLITKFTSYGATCRTKQMCVMNDKEI